MRDLNEFLQKRLREDQEQTQKLRMMIAEKQTLHEQEIYETVQQIKRRDLASEEQQAVIRKLRKQILNLQDKNRVLEHEN